MSTAWRPKPTFVMPDFGHPILRSQTLWLTANDASRAPKDILQNAYAAFALSSTVTLSTGVLGSGWKTNDTGGGGYVDLGSTNRFLTSDSQPCTFSWVENYAGIATFNSIFCLYPTGASVVAYAFRGSGSSGYGNLAVGCKNGSAVPQWGGPPAVSLLQPVVFVVRAANGTANTTAANWRAWWRSNAGSGTDIASGTGVPGSNSTPSNTFGYDSGNNKFVGVLDNFRIWNRALSDNECQSLVADPYIGCIRRNDSRGIMRFIYNKLSFTGNVKEGGVNKSGVVIWALDSTTGALVATTTSDGSGNFTIDHTKTVSGANLASGGSYDIVAVGPTGDNSAIFHAVTPGP